MAIDSLRKSARLQRLIALRHIDDPAPQHELADGVGEEAVGDRIASVDRGLRPFASADRKTSNGAPWVIWVKKAPEAPKLSTASWPVFCLEQRGDFFRRLGEVGGDGDMGHVRMDRRRKRSQKPYQCGGKPGQFHE